MGRSKMRGEGVRGRTPDNKQRTVQQEYARRLALIYRDKAPDKMKMIANLLRKYEGAEHKLYVKVAKKYRLRPQAQYFGPNGASEGGREPSPSISKDRPGRREVESPSVAPSVTEMSEATT